MARFVAPLTVCLVLAAPVPRAHAQRRELQEAREAYASGEYERVRALLHPMVGGLVPAIDDPLIVRDSRRYLGAAYVLLDRREDAELQFTWLVRNLDLEQLRRTRLEPTVFLARVREVFNRIRDARMRELEAEADQADRREAERQARRHAALLRLVDLAQSAELTVDNDPLPTFIPFGVGQFANGNEGLGILLAIAQGLTLVGSAVTLATFVALVDQNERALAGEPGVPLVPNTTLLGLGIANWASVGMFVAFAAAGIIEARINFVPTRTRRIEREIPPDVLEELELAIRPGALVLRGRF